MSDDRLELDVAAMYNEELESAASAEPEGAPLSFADTPVIDDDEEDADESSDDSAEVEAGADDKFKLLPGAAEASDGDSDVSTDEQRDDEDIEDGL